uniref:Uncharacterized protein n=2 Tax=Oryza sativa subsp. japonica TaxID=39947 RepID=Q53N38_ORYSJ|nr:hypothetical protein LOC_Os11g16800 [Oryza sativa Japonica Group]ABA92563.1 hypothetical protein LOC_Os11g16800 [Oryza sativa Japonica Group]
MPALLPARAPPRPPARPAAAAPTRPGAAAPARPQLQKNTERGRGGTGGIQRGEGEGKGRNELRGRGEEGMEELMRGEEIERSVRGYYRDGSGSGYTLLPCYNISHDKTGAEKKVIVHKELPLAVEGRKGSGQKALALLEFVRTRPLVTKVWLW